MVESDGGKGSSNTRGNVSAQWEDWMVDNLHLLVHWAALKKKANSMGHAGPPICPFKRSHHCMETWMASDRRVVNVVQ